MIKFVNDALKHRNGEKGFSLVELIVVVAILGILVVIAIPVFGAIQQTARENTVKTAAANAATSIAAEVTNTPTGAAGVITKLNAQGDDVKYNLAPASGTGDFTLTNKPSTSPAGTISVPAAARQNAANNSTDTVYVYAVDKLGNWAGAGSVGAAKNGTAAAVTP